MVFMKGGGYFFGNKKFDSVVCNKKYKILLILTVSLFLFFYHFVIWNEIPKNRQLIEILYPYNNSCPPPSQKKKS